MGPCPGACRVVICGAGIVGASIAYYLAQRGVASTLVEREEVACAASGKAGGFLALDWNDSSPVGASRPQGEWCGILNSSSATMGHKHKPLCHPWHSLPGCRSSRLQLQNNDPT